MKPIHVQLTHKTSDIGVFEIRRQRPAELLRGPDQERQPTGRPPYQVFQVVVFQDIVQLVNEHCVLQRTVARIAARTRRPRCLALALALALPLRLTRGRPRVRLRIVPAQDGRSSAAARPVDASGTVFGPLLLNHAWHYPCTKGGSSRRNIEIKKKAQLPPVYPKTKKKIYLFKSIFLFFLGESSPENHFSPWGRTPNPFFFFLALHFHQVCPISHRKHRKNTDVYIQ